MYFTSEVRTLDLFSSVAPEELLSKGAAGILEAYEGGYYAGLSWPYEWKHTPGGPWIYDNQTLLENDAWLKGWRVGINERGEP